MCGTDSGQLAWSPDPSTFAGFALATGNDTQDKSDAQTMAQNMRRDAAKADAAATGHNCMYCEPYTYTCTQTISSYGGSWGYSYALIGEHWYCTLTAGDPVSYNVHCADNCWD